MTQTETNRNAARCRILLREAARKSRTMGTTTSTTEYVIPELTQLLAIARQELDRHVRDQGTCSRCEQHWPCPTACLAAGTLSAL